MKNRLATWARMGLLMGAAWGCTAHAEVIRFDNLVDMQGVGSEYFESGFVFSAAYLAGDVSGPELAANPDGSGLLTIRHQDGKPFDFYHLDFRPVINIPTDKLTFVGETMDGRKIQLEVPSNSTSKFMRRYATLPGMISITFRTEFRQLRQLTIGGVFNGRIDNVSLAVSSDAPAAPTWTQIATEWSSFTVNGTQTVRFGANSDWIEKSVTGPGRCANDFFGSDPSPGNVKVCQVKQ